MTVEDRRRARAWLIEHNHHACHGTDPIPLPADVASLAEQFVAVRAEAGAALSRLTLKHRCPACGRMTRDTTAGCDHCEIEDK